MAFALLNGLPVFHGLVVMPRSGAWTADLQVDSAAVVTGPCTLAISGGLTLVGTAHRTGVWLDTARMRVVAGADGLGKTARPQHYRQTTLRVVLLDLLKMAGETLSPTADATTLGLTFPAWWTMALPIGRMVAALLEDTRIPETSWRMLPDGSLWVGPETWPDSKLVDLVDYQDLEEWPEDGKLELGVEAPVLVPGTLIGGRRVSRVEHRIDGETARTAAWVE